MIGRPHRVVIVGAGLAGMAAAVALESAGADVTLLEASRRLGGRAGSFQDPKTGEELDNCQHVLLGCCTNLLDFYRRIGADDKIHAHRTLHFVDATGRRYALGGMRGVPAPLHLAPSLLKFNLLTIRERIALSNAMTAMLRLGRDGRAKWSDAPFGDWLDAHRQPASLVQKLYDPVLIGALNEETRRANAAYAIQVFQDSLLFHSGGYWLGLPACPLSRLYANLPCRDVRLGARVAELNWEGERVAGVELASGEKVTADAVVLATNHHAVQRWTPAELAARDARFQRLDQLESVPILGAHLWFDRPVLRESHAALVSGPLQWIFRKNASGDAVHGVISAAREWVDRPKDECLALFTRQLNGTLPAAKDARLLSGVVVIEKRATFAASAGVDRNRPSQAPAAGGLSNLFLAGDYTLTGWPATMEGAVRSGYLAAEAVLKAVSPTLTPPNFLVPDLPLQWPARLVRQAVPFTDSN